MAEKTFTVQFDDETWNYVSKLLFLQQQQEPTDEVHSAIMAMGTAKVRFS